MTTLLNVSIDSEETIFPMPKNKDGFLFLYALDKQLLNGLLQRENEEVYKILDVMTSTCITVNALNVMRKRAVSFEKALDYCQVWVASLPWKGLVGFNKKQHYTFEEDLFSDFFMESFAKSQLQQKENGVEILHNTINKAYQRTKSASASSHDEIMLYQYLEYALDELKQSWEDLSLDFIAPLYSVGEKDESKYGSCGNEDIVSFDYLPSYQMTEVYQQETQKIISGHFDKNGNFKVFDLESSVWDDEDLFADISDSTCDFNENTNIFDDCKDGIFDCDSNNSPFADNEEEDFFSKCGTDIFDSSNDFPFSEDDLFCMKDSEYAFEMEENVADEEEFDEFFDDDDEIFGEGENNMNGNNEKGQIISFAPFHFGCKLFDETDEEATALFEMFGDFSDDFFDFYEEFTKNSTGNQ